MKKYVLLIMSMFVMSCSNTEHKLVGYDSEDVIVSTSSLNDNLLDSSKIDLEYVTSLKLPEDIIDIVSTKFTFEYGHFFIMDDNVNKTVLVFDSLGNYVSKLGKRGRAKNEYVQAPTDFFVKSNGEVCVFEQDSRRVLQFSVFGDFIDAIKFDMFPYSVCATNSNNFFCAFNHKDAKDGLQLALMSSNEEVLDGYLDLNENHRYIASNRTFFKNNDLVYHIPDLSDSILVFNKDSIDKVINIKFDCDFLPNKIKSDIYDDNMEEYHGYTGVKRIMEYYETNKFRFIKYMKSVLVMNSLINKENNQQICFLSVPFSGFFPPCSFYVKDDKMYFIITKENVNTVKDSMSAENLSKYLHDSHKVVRNMFSNVYDFPIVLSLRIK